MWILIFYKPQIGYFSTINIYNFKFGFPHNWKFNKNCITKLDSWLFILIPTWICKPMMGSYVGGGDGFPTLSLTFFLIKKKWNSLWTKNHIFHHHQIKNRNNKNFNLIFISWSGVVEYDCTGAPLLKRDSLL